ncbi:MAG TPA: hypothetical protein ENI51_02300 [Candidatus Atribacteria bacterium]|nr:hypothetical protein [Candidatus Atribacteria bacterium]
MNYILATLILSLPFYGFSCFNIMNRGIQFSWLLSILLIFVYILRINVFKHKIAFHVNKLNLIMLFYLFLITVYPITLIFESSERITSYFTLFCQYFLGIITAIVISNLPRKFDKIILAFRMWIVSGIIVSSYGIYQGFGLLYGWPFTTLILTNPSGSSIQRFGGGTLKPPFRVPSVFGEPFWYGMYLLPPLFLTVLFLFTKTDKRFLFPHRGFNYIILFLLFTAFYLSGSLGAYISLILASFISLFLILKMKKALLIIKKSTIIIFGLMLVLIVFSDYFDVNPWKEVFWTTKWLLSGCRGLTPIYVTGVLHSAPARLHMTLAALSLFTNFNIFQFLLGGGLNYLELHPATSPYVKIEIKSVPNGYVQTLIDTGIIGFLMIISMLLIPLFQLKRELRKISNDNIKIIVYGAIMFLVIYGIEIIYRPWDYSFWIMLGIVGATINCVKSEKRGI